MIKLILIDFFDNAFFYNVLMQYQQKHPEQFVINFNLKYVEGNFPQSFWTQYNYLYKEKYQIFDINKFQVPFTLCFDLNNKNLNIEDLNDQYLLTILSIFNNKNHFIHCDSLQLVQKIKEKYNYHFVNSSYSNLLNIPINIISDEDKIYNFSNRQLQYINTNINWNLIKDNQIYKLMINKPIDIIDTLILPNYQLSFIKEYKQFYEKEICSTRIMGESLVDDSIFKLL